MALASSASDSKPLERFHRAPHPSQRPDGLRSANALGCDPSREGRKPDERGDQPPRSGPCHVFVAGFEQLLWRHLPHALRLVDARSEPAGGGSTLAVLVSRLRRRRADPEGRQGSQTRGGFRHFGLQPSSSPPSQPAQGPPARRVAPEHPTHRRPAGRAPRSAQRSPRGRRRRWERRALAPSRSANNTGLSTGFNHVSQARYLTFSSRTQMH